MPSTMHQKLIVWREDGLVEYVEADQSAYMIDANTVTLKSFDKHLASIAPCGEQDAAFDHEHVDPDSVYHSVRLHPTHGFCWEREHIENPLNESDFPEPSGWGDFNGYDD